MEHPRRRLALTLAGVAGLAVASALLYMAGMARLEGKPRGFWDSLEWAAETLTTTGYGADAHWNHPVMVLFVVGVQFAGVFLVFLIVPLFLIPFLESRFEVRLPQEVADLAKHVVIYRYGPAVETLLGELAAAGVTTVLLEEDDGVARRLFEAGERVLHRPLDDAALRAARLPSARALIANGSDDANAALILAARQTGFTGPILALVEEPFHRRPMMLAGASAVFTPRHILGAALAARASARIDRREASVQQLGRNLAVTEVRIEPRSPLAGRTLAEAAIGAETGATIIGQWIGGQLRALPEPSVRLQADGVLVVAGRPESLLRVGELARGTGGGARRGPFVVGGFGEVGRKVVELLLAVGEEVKVIDRRSAPGVDLVGNAIDPGILEAAGAAQAQAVILALDSDSATLFATVILKDSVPEVPVIARVNQAENVDRIHRAGAYFALSISQVSGQMLARKLLGEEAVALDPRLKVQRVPAADLRRRFRGRGRATLALSDLERRPAGCAVIAVERGEEVIVDLSPGFRFGPDDVLYVCGSAAAVRRFSEGLAPPQT